MANAVQIIIQTIGSRKASSDLGEVGGSAGRLSGSVARLGGALAAAGIGAALTSFGVAAFNAAGQADTLRESNERLARSINTTSDALISGIQAASGGTISSLDALQASNQALLFGIVQNQGEMEELTRIAVTLGRATGQTGTKSLADLSTALSRNSPLILDNLGLTVDTAKANEVYAASIGKSVQALTDEEKSLAFRAAALEAGRAKVEELGAVTEANASSTEKLAAAYSDLTVNFGRLLTEGNKAIDFVTGFVVRLNEGAVAWQNMAGLATQAINLIVQHINNLSEGTERFLSSLGVEIDFPHIEQLAGKVTAHTQELADLSAISAREAEAMAEAMAETERAAARSAVNLQAMTITARTFSSGIFDRGQSFIDSQVGAGQRAEAQRQQQAAIASAQAQKRAIEEQRDAARAAAQEQQQVYRQMADNIKSVIEGQLQPTLSQVWQPPSQDQRIDEWARRLATLATDGLGSEWAGALQAEFGGQSFFEPIAAALQGGDSAALKEAATNLLTGPNVTQLWDKELIKQRVRESLQQQNIKQELVNEIFRELSAEGLNVSMGDVSAVAGGGGTPIAGNLVQGMAAGLPDAISKSDTTGIIIRQIDAGMKDQSEQIAQMAHRFAAAFNSAIPEAFGTTGGLIIEVITMKVLERLGTPGGRP